MDWISGGLGAIGEFRNILTSLTAKSKSTNVHKKLIIRELRDNLRKYESVFKNNLSVDLLIDNLDNEAVENAIQDNFDFKKLKRGEIPEKLIREPRNKKYAGWTAETLIDKIDEKIEELKNLKRLNKGTVLDLRHSNTHLMLSNLFYRMKLLARFIND